MLYCQVIKKIVQNTQTIKRINDIEGKNITEVNVQVDEICEVMNSEDIDDPFSSHDSSKHRDYILSPSENLSNNFSNTGTKR